MRHIYAQQLSCQQFRKESKKLQTKIMFERYYSIFRDCLLYSLVRDVSKTYSE